MTNLCADCHLVPAVPGLRLCFECLEDASAAVDASRSRPQYTGDICHWCGDNLTTQDAISSSPNTCAKCRREADRADTKHLPHSLAEWIKDADANRICEATRL